MKKINKAAIMVFLFAIALSGITCPSLCQESPVVSIIVDADIPSNPSSEEVKAAGGSLINQINEIDPYNRNVTIFVSGEMATVYRLRITSLGAMSNHELALYGNNTGENLSSFSAAEQEEILKNANKRLYSCYVCGGKHVDIKGFRPQGFEQNEDTLRVLENLSIIYNAGFQQGLIYMPGHENDSWPYLIEGSNIYAVPISTTDVNGEKAVLYDKYIRDDMGLSGSQWQDLLQSQFDENAKAGAPTVVIFSNLVSGDGDFLDTYRNFLNYAESQGARFLTTFQLVDMTAAKNLASSIPELEKARKGAEDVSPDEKGAIADCPTCDDASSGKGASIISFSIRKNESCINCTQNSTNFTEVV
ncbi:hypothetical protein [Methanothrix sp.]|uniref:hypothetical protein n=1 Tax=Methanothrix sp. TaxID=90426 RepID=UPI003296D83A